MTAFADNKTNVTQKLRFALGRVENIVGKGENAGYQHFLFSLQCFQEATLWLLWVKQYGKKRIAIIAIRLIHIAICITI